MTTEVENAWVGAEELRPLLVAVESVTVHPNNPRRGDVLAVARSLERYGQLKPIVVSRDGLIVAGNQLYRAAVEILGWTQVASVMADHLTGEDPTMYMLADNLASDQATYDHALVAAHREYLLTVAASLEDGPQRDAVAAAADSLTRLAARATAPEEFRTIDPDGMPVDYRCLDCGFEWAS